MNTIYDILAHFRATSFTEKDKGTQFERLMRAWLKTSPTYAPLLETVWLWEEFPARGDFGGKDTGIDLVAKTYTGDYWAIQCKCYAEKAVIDKPAVDSFLATSSRTFQDEQTLEEKRFARRMWIATTNHWGDNATEAIQNQDPPLFRVSLADLAASAVDWGKLYDGLTGADAHAPKKQLRKHQREALSAAHAHYQTAERGTLVMACGTGKTFTSLRLVEQEVGKQGLVLFLVPSIALLGQSLNDWMADASGEMHAVCICSDGRASRRMKRSSDADDGEESVVDLAYPASTSVPSIVRQLRELREKTQEGLVVVFSTYQSIDVVAEAQRALLSETGGDFGTFDFIVCDEAHRTTGVKFAGRDESHFTKVHEDAFLAARKRLYMTATPRIYGENVKVKASKLDGILCSMDSQEIYGEVFHRVNFSYAVQNGILTDYKVLVLTVSEEMIPEKLMAQIKDKDTKELSYDDTGRLIGVINALSKKILGDKGLTWDADPRLMRRALAFTHKIGRADDPGSSKNIAAVLPHVSELYNQSLSEEERGQIVHVTARHVDGGMGALERNEALQWLAEEADDPQECRVISNVRCLSEGVDVPALDAVLFLSARNSQVDVVQSVGRVMRSFRRGQPGEKKYGYIIIPVIVPEGTSPEEALADNKAFAVIWDILNALRAHDDHFNAHVNTIALNRDKGTKVTVGLPGFLPQSSTDGATGLASGASGGDANDGHDALLVSNQQIAHQLELQFGATQQSIYAKLVEKCGDRLYWENWAGEVGVIAKKYIERIGRLVSAQGGKLAGDFATFVHTLQQNLNPGITAEQCIEMLAQHLITRPVFEALFADYHFVENNSISSSMQRMIELLEQESVDKDLEVLSSFYQSVQENVGKVDNLEGKQTVIKNLYEKFFKRAFPMTVEKLGTVYTPVECVDFILHSVEDVLQSEFGARLTDEGVHILDPFTGTGTFITRLLQSGLIRPEDACRKYLHEIHANELILLAYYIADVNIESVFQEQYPQSQYLPYDGICLTDTFQIGEEGESIIDRAFFGGNTDAVEAQRKAPIRVIIGNPPYSVGQKSANDNAQNQSYPHLDAQIASTYAAGSTATNKNALYDSYIRAFRWATDRLTQHPDGGVVAFISNGAWIDGNSHDGFRASLQKEYDKIYVFNLRGNQRTSGELSRREGGKIFGSGSRTPISITLLIRYPEGKRQGTCQIHYRDIGDYLSREDKLRILTEAGSYRHLEWTTITPNEKNDWINQRDGLFDTLLPLAPEKRSDSQAQSAFASTSNGFQTNRDTWVYNYSSAQLKEQIQRMIAFYNEQLGKAEPSMDETKISWTRGLKKIWAKKTVLTYQAGELSTAMYRPFTRMRIYADRSLVEYPAIRERYFPTPQHGNLCICLCAAGENREFSCSIVDQIPDLHLIGTTQCFPLYWYEENTPGGTDLFGEASAARWTRRDGVTDWMLGEVRSRFSGAKSLTKEDIFYYVYGLLHSPDYRVRFADDLRKALPRIPIVETVEDFMAFSKVGRALAELHLHYEDYAHQAGVTVEEAPQGSLEDYAYYAVEKMRFPTKGDRTTILYNGRITLTGIPEGAYDYIVNGKSAIEWVMERYAVTTDRKSGLRNDPNLWAREQGRPRYILDLLLSVIHVSLETQRLIARLPRLSF